MMVYVLAAFRLILIAMHHLKTWATVSLVTVFAVTLAREENRTTKQWLKQLEGAHLWLGLTFYVLVALAGFWIVVRNWNHIRQLTQTLLNDFRALFFHR